MHSHRHRQAIERLRIERGAAHLCALGPRATAEFLVELSDTPGARDRMVAMLDRWRTHLTPSMVRLALGGAAQFPPHLTAVPDELAATSPELETLDQRPAGAGEAG